MKRLLSHSTLRSTVSRILGISLMLTACGTGMAQNRLRGGATAIPAGHQ